MLETIEDLCYKHTYLEEKDIEIIYEKSKTLQQTADLTQANLFIDCPTKDRQHSIVVAEAKPSYAPSLYKTAVVGKFAYASFEPAVIYTHKTGKPMTRKLAITQEAKHVKQNVIPIKNEQNQTIGSMIMEQDISEQVNHENELKALSKTTEQLSQTLIGLTEQDSIISNMIHEALLLLDPLGVISYHNSFAGYMIEEMVGKTEVIGTPIYMCLPFLQTINDKTDDIMQEEINVGKRTFEVKQIRLRKNNRLTGTLIVIRDLTELRQKERELMVKSAVLQEIHHRVKNNLQTVASLLRLQMKRIPTEEKVHFHEGLNRILSIAAVHEELLESTNINVVEIRQLTERIGNMLIRNLIHHELDISISFHGEQTYLKSEQAVSVALIINELIQNCLKHAFQGLKQGEIIVCFYNCDKHLEVHVKDNGIGYSPTSQSSLGLEIVDAIINHDLSGSFSIEKMNKGTKAVINFPVIEVNTGDI